MDHHAHVDDHDHVDHHAHAADHAPCKILLIQQRVVFVSVKHHGNHSAVTKLR